MANTREIRDAAEKAESKAKAAAAKKEFEKAADYFSFAADAYLRIGKQLDAEKQAKCEARASRLEQFAKQCRAALKRGGVKAEPPEELKKSAEPPPAEDEPAPPADDSFEESGADELSLTNESEDETVEIDIPGEDDEEPEESEVSLTDEVMTESELEEPPPKPEVPPPPARPGVKIPKTKKLKPASIPGKGPARPAAKNAKKKKSSQVIAPPPTKKKPDVVTAPKPVAASTDDEAESPEPDLNGEPVLGKRDSQRAAAVASEGDLAELADTTNERPASVVISLDNDDFPEQKLEPNEFSIDLSPRFTEHICKALTMGDVSQIAVKFNKLADNLIRKAMGGDPRDELDLRFTALACREVADRLTAAPPGDPTDEIEKARRAYRRGDRKAAAELYKKAAVALLGTKDESDEKTSKHERQASEYLSFSSRLRQVGK